MYLRFLEFAHALCASAGAATPPLEPDANGMITFHMILHDVAVNITSLIAGEALTAQEDAFILVTFGDIPAGQELDVLTLLAEANFTMVGADMPVFGMNPATRQIVLRQRVVLAQTNAASAFEFIVRMVDLVLDWRANPMLAPVDGCQFDGSGDESGGLYSRRFA
ncbi:hypothetical protein BH11PSE7_BH11PSE7_20220 [soil metagenome]